MTHPGASRNTSHSLPPIEIVQDLSFISLHWSLLLHCTVARSLRIYECSLEPVFHCSPCLCHIQHEAFSAAYLRLFSAHVLACPSMPSCLHSVVRRCRHESSCPHLFKTLVLDTWLTCLTRALYFALLSTCCILFWSHTWPWVRHKKMSSVPYASILQCLVAFPNLLSA